MKHEYSEEFRKQACGMVQGHGPQRPGRSIKDVAAELEVPYTTLQKWYAEHTRKTAPKLETDNPAGNIANRAFHLLHAELFKIEETKGKNGDRRLDTGRLKAILDATAVAAKILKDNPEKPKADKPKADDPVTRLSEAARMAA